MLILDDFCMQPFDTQSRGILMDIIEDRHQRPSTMVTSQIPVKDWYDVIGEQTIAAAVLDRFDPIPDNNFLPVLLNNFRESISSVF